MLYPNTYLSAFAFFLTACTSTSPEFTTSKKVDFSASRKQLIAGESIFFYDKSTSSPNSLEWTFEKGTPEISTEKDPKVTYLEAGKFTVSVKVNYADEQIEKTEKEFVTVLKRTDPPFSGTIFIENNIISDTDPTSYVSIKPTGQGIRTMYDRRLNNWVQLEAHLFEVTFKTRTVEVQVNPEFSREAALELAQKYSIAIGRMPGLLLRDVETVWIHDGLNPFGGGNKNLLIHTKQADQYEKDGILEETLVHEASHTSLDAYHAKNPRWVQAQKEDPTFISTYARDNPDREDVAETFLLYLAVKHRADRISEENKHLILATIPNRIKYFDSLNLDFSSW